MCCSETFEVFLMNCVSDEMFLIVTVCSPYIDIYVFTCQIHIGIKRAEHAPLNAVHTFLD